MNLCNPTELKALLNRHEFNFSKTLGQNFLIDKNVLNKIVSASELNENSCVLEIGPGAGTLTAAACRNGRTMHRGRNRQGFLPILGETLAGFDNFNLINSDILKVDLKKLIKDEFDNKPFHVIANLPYYITTPIIMQILESRLPVVSMTLMVQKEVADRMCATCGSKEYGALSVAVQYYTIPTVICRAEPHCFIPQPKVASSVVHLKVSATPTVTVSDEKKFFAIVKSSFGQRRKTLLNALSKSPYFSANKDSVRSALVQMGVDENIRGEKLSISQFAKLSELL